MTHNHLRVRHRGGFTIVEMMVSTALIIFIMYILASAFQQGLETFRMLKVAGDMQEKLRTASVVLRNDLFQTHFDDANKPYLSTQDIHKDTWTPPTGGFFRIENGVAGENDNPSEGAEPEDLNLPLTRGLPLTIFETQASAKQTRLASSFPYLQFTVRLKGERRDQYFSAKHNFAIGSLNNLNNWSKPEYTRLEQSAAGSTYASNSDSYFNSVWAEVTYFVQPTPGATAGANQRYGLYRRVKLLYEQNQAPANSATDPPQTPPNAAIAKLPPDRNYLDLSFWRRPSGSASSISDLNTPTLATAPLRRFGMVPGKPTGVPGSTYFWGQADYPYPPTANTPDTLLCPCKDAYTATADQAGVDLLLADLTDFQIKVLWDWPDPSSTTFVPYYKTIQQSMQSPAVTTNADYPFDFLPSAPFNPGLQGHRIFDTWSKETDPNSTSPEYSYSRPLVPLPSPHLAPAPYSESDLNTVNWNFRHVVGSSPYTLNDPNAAMPLRVRVRALQIKLRIWDVKSQQTRQITIIQDV